MISTRSGTPSPRVEDALQPLNPGSFGASESHFVARATAAGAAAMAASFRRNANTKTAVFSPLAFFLKEGASRASSS